MTQTGRGKAFEYALAQQLSTITKTPISDDEGLKNARDCYDLHGVEEMDNAAAEAVLFLQAMDSQFDNAVSIQIQTDARGQAGDTRDVVVHYFGGEIGLSAKNNHRAVKHSRLSSTIDFGSRWADRPVSSDYWNRVKPIFQELATFRTQGALFKDLTNKESRIYLPILTAFEDEFRRLCQDYGADFIGRVFQHIVGLQDFYKVVRQKDHVSIQSFNLNGSLEWGSRWRIPQDIAQIQRKPRSMNTLLVTFSGGWQLSFRIHNASSRVEPSLKFDIQFVALPVTVANHQIRLDNISHSIPR